ncbi:3',5'-cyclic-nucleotide phosphodiesterase [Pseudoalteromonas sp. 13-15]|uniref:metallophosphoesterase n=1 Tax=Pseudoalteromonas TaxID=53246 RepID=UPI0007316454|nr:MULTISPECIES: metallophosphoesterase [Pseudoalteromonas]AUL73725.1 3',5'-cyclic-nucleotide phosphodiesterase [Pseudoalteromonas sp. 13-15]WFO18777.1 metallophosphoesterase [Pseudoalteromonas sp. H100]SIN92133.1 Icc protein [Pseudoalteromonas marina]
MAWFDEPYLIDKSSLRIAHITDCHLFSNKAGEYFGVNTANYFEQALAHMAKQSLDFVIFGGDLTQDHSAESYFLFSELINQSDLRCPVFWVPGNHDDIAQLNRMSGGQINRAKHIVANGVELLLINSKGPTPAGWVTGTHLNEITERLFASASSKIMFCHHNPLPIDGYLDKHMLENGPQLLNILVNSENVFGLFHGHVHNEYMQTFRALPIYATPASSVQFKKHSPEWIQQDHGPAYRLICVSTNKENISTDMEVVWLNG